jgi:hypothetical protein
VGRVTVENLVTGERQEVENLEVDGMLEGLSRWLLPTSGIAPLQIAAGSSDTAATTSDTNLGSLIDSWRDITGSKRSSASVTLYCHFPSSASNGTWKEVGLRDSEGRLWARTVLASPMTKDSSTGFLVTWVLTFL